MGRGKRFSYSSDKGTITKYVFGSIYNHYSIDRTPTIGPRQITPNYFYWHRLHCFNQYNNGTRSWLCLILIVFMARSTCESHTINCDRQLVQSIKNHIFISSVTLIMLSKLGRNVKTTVRYKI